MVAFQQVQKKELVKVQTAFSLEAFKQAYPALIALLYNRLSQPVFGALGVLQKLGAKAWEAKAPLKHWALVIEPSPRQAAGNVLPVGRATQHRKDDNSLDIRSLTPQPAPR